MSAYVMALVNYGSEAPGPREVSGGWAIPLGVSSSTDDDDLVSYTAHEVVAQTLFQHDIEAAIAAADDLPEGDYTPDVLEAIKHGIRLQRAAEYPPASDYLDGVAKGDQEQIDAYIAACLAVKEKYPFPTLEELTGS